MRLTGLIWTCKKCDKEFEVFADDGTAQDFVVCWNYCPYCGTKNDLWVRFKRPGEQIKVGVDSEVGRKICDQK